MNLSLRCCVVGREVWFELTDWDLNKRQSLEENTISESDLYLILSKEGKLYPFQDSNILTDGVYLSYGEFMEIHLQTGDAPNGRGFKGFYKTSEKILTPLLLSDFSFARIFRLKNICFVSSFLYALYCYLVSHIPIQIDNTRIK